LTLSVSVFIIRLLMAPLQYDYVDNPFFILAQLSTMEGRPMSPPTAFVNIVGGLFLKLNPTPYIYFWAMIGGALCNALTAGFLGLLASRIFRGSHYLIIAGVLVSFVGSPFDNMDAIIQYYTLSRLLVIIYLYLFIYLVSRETDMDYPYLFLGMLNAMLIFCLPQLIFYLFIPLIFFSIESFLFKSQKFRWKEFLFILVGFFITLLLMLGLLEIFGFYAYPEPIFSFHEDAPSLFALMHDNYNYHDLFMNGGLDFVWVILIVLLFVDEHKFKTSKSFLFCLTLCLPICYLILKFVSVYENDIHGIFQMQFALYSYLNRIMLLFPCYLVILFTIYYFYPDWKKIFSDQGFNYHLANEKFSMEFKLKMSHQQNEESQGFLASGVSPRHSLKIFLKKFSKLSVLNFVGISTVCCFVVLTFHVFSSMGLYRAYYMQPIALLFFLIPAIQLSIYRKKRIYIISFCIFMMVASLLIQNTFSYSQPLKTSFTDAFISAPLRGLFYEKKYVLTQNEFIQEASQYIQPGTKIFMPSQEYGLLLALNARPQYVSYFIPGNHLKKLQNGERPEWILLHPQPWWEEVIRKEFRLRFMPEDNLMFAPFSCLQDIKLHLPKQSTLYGYIDMIYWLRKIILPEEYELVIKQEHYRLYRHKGRTKHSHEYENSSG